MAVDTNTSLRNQVMYSVFVRNYSKEGTFKKVTDDVQRIKALGVDIVWLMPIHPVGERKRKGTLGSPYAIKDYRAVNPEFGTLDDLKELVSAIHDNGMKCIIDVVYNHTAPDSVLAKEHPEWFYHKADGSFGNKIGDWSDIIDLDYTQRGLWDYQIETLKQWAKIVDGFRCDVAPLVPLDFWLRARKEVAAVHPECIWLSESVEPAFVYENRKHGIPCLSDSEIFQAFDVSYEYDIYWDYVNYLAGKSTLVSYADQINRQEGTFPANYVKLRYLENHDRPRAKFLIANEQALRNWTSFIYFQKGLTLLYNGQEKEADRRPSLFDKDTIVWNTERDLTPLMQKLYQIKKTPLFASSVYHAEALGNNVLFASHADSEHEIAGIFCTTGTAAAVKVSMPDGSYKNMIDGKNIQVECGILSTTGEPIIMQVK